MRIRNSFNTLLLILWIGLLVNNFLDLMDYFMQFGLSAFSLPPFLFNLAFFIITIFMCITLFTGRNKIFAVLFAVYTLTETLYSGSLVLEISRTATLDSVISSGDFKLLLYFLSNFYLEFFVFAVYVISFVAMLIMFFMGARKRYKMSNITVYVGYAIAVVRVVAIVSWFMNRTGGFEFIEILFDLLSTIFFSIIYISVPRNLPYYFD